MTSSGILFLSLSRVATPLLGLFARYFFCLLPPRGFDRGTYFVWKFFSSGVFLRCVIGFFRNISRAIFQIAMGRERFYFNLLCLAGSTSSSKQMDWISGSTGTDEPDYTYRCDDPRKSITLTSYSAWCFHMCLFDVSDRRTS